ALGHCRRATAADLETHGKRGDKLAVGVGRELPGRRDLDIVPAGNVGAVRHTDAAVTAAEGQREMRKYGLAVFEFDIGLVVAERKSWQRQFVSGKGIIACDCRGKEARADHAMADRRARRDKRERESNGEKSMNLQATHTPSWISRPDALGGQSDLAPHRLVTARRAPSR